MVQGRKIVDYQILDGGSSDVLSYKVREKIENGYELHGELKMVATTRVMYAQAVIKYADEPDVGEGEVC